MAGIAIVAIPEQDDPVWKVSSEKVPHLTLLYLEGPLDNEENTIRFIQHAAKTSLKRFGMSVDRRGTLGADNADVVFLDKRYGGKELVSFRGYLLANTDILTAYNKAEQYPVWTPHVTLGFPESPANKVDEKLYWINFDRIAVWTGDYVGPEFMLDEDRGMEVDIPGSWSEDDFGNWLRHHEVSGINWGVRETPDPVTPEEEIEHIVSELDDVLAHFGVRGMKWGVRRAVGPNGLALGRPPGLKKGGGKSDTDGDLAVTKGKKLTGSADHQKLMKNLDKKVEDLSTADIRDITARIKAVNDFKATTAAEKAAQASIAKKVTAWALSQVAQGAKSRGEKYIQELVGDKIVDVLPKTPSQVKRDLKAKMEQEQHDMKKRREAENAAKSSSGSTTNTSTSTSTSTSSGSSPSRDREAAVRDLTDAVLKSDGVYEITTKKKGG